MIPLPGGSFTTMRIGMVRVASVAKGIVKLALTAGAPEGDFEIAAKLARPRSDYAALAATTESRSCSARPVASWPCAAARQDLTASRSVNAMASGFSVAASDAAFPSASQQPRRILASGHLRRARRMM